MAQGLHEQLKDGDDKAIATGVAFALTRQLQEVGHDRHVRVGMVLG